MSKASEQIALAIEGQQTNAERLLQLLSDGRWHHMRELHDVAGWRFGGRLHELKKSGRLDFEKRRISPREWEYRGKP